MNTLHTENNLSKLTIHKNSKDKHKLTINDYLLSPNPEIITSLNLSNCNLTELPNLSLTNLLDVNLSHNHLENVPQLIYDNNKIQTLNLSNNKLTNFNKKPKCCSFLLDLNLSNNYLTNIPSWIYSRNCDDLSTLKLSDNPFVHEQLLLGRYLKSLKNLELNNTNFRLNKKPQFLTEIPKLEQLHLSNTLTKKNINFIKELHFGGFTFASFLKELHLTGLGISAIPEDIVVLEHLEILNLNKNYISWFPLNFARLITLKTLIISENDLLCLPPDFGELKNLQKLSISDNCVGTIPESMIHLQHLEIFDCYNNDFTEHVMDVIDKMAALKGFDCDQNLFGVSSEDYCEKRDKLRREWGFLGRVNGPKKSDDAWGCSDECDSVSSDSCAEITEYLEGGDVEPENWDVESENSISDDMDLVLPTFRFCDRSKPKFTQIEDPGFFDDVLE